MYMGPSIQAYTLVEFSCIGVLLYRQIVWHLVIGVLLLYANSLEYI